VQRASIGMNIENEKKILSVLFEIIEVASENIEIERIN
jgi:hypothetical protein